MDLLGTRRVDPVHQSPRTRAYGFFTKGTVPTSLFLAHLVSFLLPTVFAGRLPRPTSVAGCPVTWLSPRFIGSRVGGGASGIARRWPPSAAQTVYAGFPHTAFTKTQTTEMPEKESTQPG